MADFPYAEWLTRQYRERAEGSNCWTDYIKAHGLANYCLVKHPTDERRKLVYEIEVSWYKGKHPLTCEEHQKKTGEHKRLLEAFRDDTAADFKGLKKRHQKLITNNKEVLSPANIDRAKKFSSDVVKTSEKCTEQFCSFSKFIIESSVDILHQAGKSAPCKFAVIGLGSAAKGEVTPYSDLEYAFIVEHEDEYFQALAVDSYFRIGNLGETPLKCFDIEELKIEKGSTPILSSNDTVGYRIDGITEKAGNIPTGNGREDGHKLTLTVDDLMKLYRTSAQSPFDGVAGDKSDMLSSTVLIYTNEGRESHLYQQFLEKRKIAESELTSNKDVIAKRLDSFTKDVESYTFLPEFVKFQPPKNLNVEVKADIFRYPTLLANHLKLWLTLEDRYPWQVYDRLQEKGVVTRKTCSYMKIVLAIALYIRTSAYLYSRTQIETLSFYPNTPALGKAAYEPPGGLFIVFGCFISPIKHQIGERTRKLGSDTSSLKLVASTLLGKLKIAKDDFFLQAEVNYFIGRYEPAMEIISRGIKCDILNSDSSTVITRIQQIDNTSTNKYVQLCTYLIYYTDNFTIAADYLQWLIDTQPDDNSFCKLLLAVCKRKTGNYKSARLLLDQVKSVNSERSLLHPFSSNESAQFDVYISLCNIGLLNHELGEYKRALRYYEECLKLSKDLHKTFTNAFTHMVDLGAGSSLLSLGHYRAALEHFTRSLEAFELLFGDQSTFVAQVCHSIGLVYMAQKNYEKALNYLKRTLKIHSDIFGSTTNCVELAATYRDIGNVYARASEHQPALENQIKSLVMYKTIHGRDTRHRDIADSLNAFGVTYFKQGNYQRALHYHNKALEMKKAIFGTDSTHPDIADEYYIIGAIYVMTDNYDKSLEHFTKSVQMNKTVYGPDTNHPNIANCHVEIRRVYQQTGDYQKAEVEFRNALTMMEAIPKEDIDQAVIAKVQQLLATLPKRRHSI